MTAERRTLLFLSVLLFVVAATIRVVSLVHGRPDLFSNPGLNQDESEYHGLARNILDGKGFRQAVPRQGLRELPRTGEPTAFRTPGMPAILAGIYTVVGDNPGYARVTLSIITAAISPLILILFVLLFRSVVIGAVLGGLWAILPTSLFMSGALYGEEISCLILLVSMLLAILAERSGVAWLVLCAGLLLGFGMLTRGFLLFAPLTLGFWLWRRKRLRLAVWLLAAAAVLPGAWVIRNGRTIGIYELSTESWEAIWLGNNRWARGSWPANWPEQRLELLKKYPNFDQLDEVGHFRVFEAETKAEVFGNPRRIAWLLPRKAVIFFLPRSWMGTDWVFGLTLPFFAVGVWVLARDRQRRHLLALVGLPMASVFAVSLLAFSDVRYRHPIDPLFFFLAGAGAQGLLDRWRRRSGQAQAETTPGPASPLSPAADPPYPPRSTSSDTPAT
jgi:hypothetical protein